MFLLFISYLKAWCIVSTCRACSFHRENATNLKGQIDSVERSESIARFRLVAFQEMKA
jgi:hypothetical protein